MFSGSVPLNWFRLFLPMRATTYKRAKSVQEIGFEMYRIAEQHANDLGSLGLLPMVAFFQRVRALPYYKEPGRFQFLSSPKWTLSGLSPVVACANKSILCGAWAKLHSVPFRFVASGPQRNQPYSHVFTQFYLDGSWKSFDPTYSWHEPFFERTFARVEILKRKRK